MHPWIETKVSGTLRVYGGEICPFNLQRSRVYPGFTCRISKSSKDGGISSYHLPARNRDHGDFAHQRCTPEQAEDCLGIDALPGLWDGSLHVAQQLTTTKLPRLELCDGTNVSQSIHIWFEQLKTNIWQ